jgi:hypothetical protein
MSNETHRPLEERIEKLEKAITHLDTLIEEYDQDPDDIKYAQVLRFAEDDIGKHTYFLGGRVQTQAEMGDQLDILYARRIRTDAMDILRRVRERGSDLFIPEKKPSG